MRTDALSRTIHDTCTQDTARLTAALALDASTTHIEVQCLLQAILQVNRAYLLTHPEQHLNTVQHARYAALFERRLNGEPLAYILGEREFFGLMFKVTPDTLIPRSETELLVELALQRVPSPSPPTYMGEGGCRRGNEFRILDLGTGSGAIALAIAHAHPAAEVLACDVSHAALEVARENMQRLGISNIAFMQSNWFSALDAQRFDLIVSNPPYIAAGDPHLQQGDVCFEPASALASGVDGLRDICHIVNRAQAHLQPNGWLLLEHGYTQAAQVRELLRQAEFDEVFSAQDMAGIERVSGGHIFS